MDHPTPPLKHAFEICGCFQNNIGQIVVHNPEMTTQDRLRDGELEDFLQRLSVGDPRFKQGKSDLEILFSGLRGEDGHGPWPETVAALEYLVASSSVWVFSRG